MNYAQIRKYDIANGVGIRTSVFVTGCTHHCKGCFNELYMDPDYGNRWTDTQTQLLIDCLKESTISGLSLLGGEPFQSEVALAEIVTQVRESGALDGKDVWVYSGYTFEQLLEDEDKKRLLCLCDVLVDGRFVEEKKDPRLRFRGSSNQRIIDVKKSLEAGEPVLIEEFNKIFD